MKCLGPTEPVTQTRPRVYRKPPRQLGVNKEEDEPPTLSPPLEAVKVLISPARRMQKRPSGTPNDGRRSRINNQTHANTYLSHLFITIHHFASSSADGRRKKP